MALVNHAAASDNLEAGLAEHVPPVHPCVVCGRETLEHTPLLTPSGKEDNEGKELMDRKDRRICSNGLCRHVVEVP